LRNTTNGKFVIGALFRRELDNPGPKLQISSDAAAALGLLAGEPGKVSVTALRREEAARSAPDASKPILDAAETVATETLDPIPGAAAEIDRAAAKDAKPTAPPIATMPASAKPAAAPPAPAAPKAPASSGKGELIQIGIFSVEANAKRASDQLKAAGIAADIRAETSQGKSFWSVTARGEKGLMAKIKQAGFKDAYFLKG
jgi:cell division septation protein DedD